MRALFCFMALACAALADDPRTGYRLQGLVYEGAGEWRQTADPIWVWEYHTLRLRYRASGIAATGDPILTLRPGAVGPVTPGANNPENPFAAGSPVVVVSGRDLSADGAVHTLTVELRGRMRTAQVDQLQFTLRAGARLEIEEMEFRADGAVFPCETGGPALPGGTRALEIRGASRCAGAPSTTLRGRESLRIAGEGRKGGALYLSALANLAGVSTFAPAEPFDQWRWKETSETANLLARIRYTDGHEEEQFPLLVSERRHVLLNRVAAVYALALDSSRALESVELVDRSPHFQIALFRAGLSGKPAPAAAGETLTIPRASPGKPSAPDVQASRWYEIRAVEGKALPGTAVRADLQVRAVESGRRATLSLTNVGRDTQEFVLVYPSLEIRAAADPQDVYYLFPRQAAVLGRDEGAYEEEYSGAFPLQFVDVFAPKANRGAAVIVRDTEARGKRFRLRKAGAAVSAEVRYAVRLAPGETVRYPDVDVVFHGGGWREGFDAYRRWVGTWYVPRGPRPAWLRSAFWARRDYPVGGSGELFDVRAKRYTFDRLIRDSEAFGGADFIDISGWALSDKVGRVGDYPIELGGPADLARNIGGAQGRGIPTGLYFEGYLVDKNSQIGRRSGAAWQIIDAAGRPMWWQGESELFVCPYVAGWQKYLAGRVASVAHQVGADAVYLDEFGFGNKRCYSSAHGHRPGVGTMEGELAMVGAVRRALNDAGRGSTALYIEETPPDAAAPYYDAAFCYALPMARTANPVKLNLWRFVFPDVRLWDMVSIGVHPRALPAEDFRLSLWHGNGAWLKGHTESWYGEDVLAFLRRAHGLLKQHAAAFAGKAEPLIASPHPDVLINRFQGKQETVYTLLNSSYRTVRFSFQGRDLAIAPREVEVVGAR